MPGIAPTRSDCLGTDKSGLLLEFFPADWIGFGSHGIAAIAFLHGLGTEEFRQTELDYHDPLYPVTITVRAMKPET
jgi:hypothetical protein